MDVDDDCTYSTLDVEIERLCEGPGAIVLLGMRDPLDVSQLDALYPPYAHFARLAQRQGAHVDAEKPIWRGTPVNAALGLVDSMGVVPNHFHRNKVWPETATWARSTAKTRTSATRASRTGYSIFTTGI